jgi:exocyst complex component 4
VLGKLGASLDLAVQRVPGEVFALVEATLDEVAERGDFTRREPSGLSTAATRTEGVYIHTTSDLLTSVAQVVTSKGRFLSASRLRMAALEPSARGPEYNVLQDFFWTLYSKLDAVVQGLRVTYEIANRIGSVSIPHPSSVLHV